MIEPATDWYQTTQTALAAWIMWRTRCGFRLLPPANGHRGTIIQVLIPRHAGETLESEYLISEYHACRAIERSLTDRIKEC